MIAADAVSTMLAAIAMGMVVALWVILRVLSASMGMTPLEMLNLPFRMPDPPSDGQAEAPSLPNATATPRLGEAPDSSNQIKIADKTTTSAG